jgi:anhydro-N-acetylmuramic acid kinase
VTLCVQVIVGGGGSKNPTLLRRIECLLNDAMKSAAVPIRVQRHEDIGISSEAKEALAFALLGFLAHHSTTLPRIRCWPWSNPV